MVETTQRHSQLKTRHFSKHDRTCGNNPTTYTCSFSDQGLGGSYGTQVPKKKKIGRKGKKKEENEKPAISV